MPAGVNAQSHNVNVRVHFATGSCEQVRGPPVRSVIPSNVCTCNASKYMYILYVAREYMYGVRSKIRIWSITYSGPWHKLASHLLTMVIPINKTAFREKVIVVQRQVSFAVPSRSHALSSRATDAYPLKQSNTRHMGSQLPPRIGKKKRRRKKKNPPVNPRCICRISRRTVHISATV